MTSHVTHLHNINEGISQFVQLFSCVSDEVFIRKKQLTDNSDSSWK